MAEEKVYLDETFAVVNYNNTAPMARLALLKRMENAQVANVRVIVDEKMTVLANVAAVSVGDDEKEVAEHNLHRPTWDAEASLAAAKQNSRLGGALLMSIAVFGGIGGLLKGDGGVLPGVVMFGGLGMWLLRRTPTVKPPLLPPELTPDYAVVIESAGTRDNALVSKDRMVVQKIVRAISDALVGSPPPSPGRPPQPPPSSQGPRTPVAPAPVKLTVDLAPWSAPGSDS